MEKKIADYNKVNAKRPRKSHLLVRQLSNIYFPIFIHVNFKVPLLHASTVEIEKSELEEVLVVVAKKKMSAHPNQTVKPGLPKNDLDDIIRKH